MSGSTTTDDFSEDGIEVVAAVTEQTVFQEAALVSDVPLRKILFFDNVSEIWKCGNKTATEIRDIKENIEIPAAENELAVREEGQPRNDKEKEGEKEINRKVRSYLNEMAEENFDDLIKRFVALPISTLEHLENVVNLIFERAIREQNCAARYAAICSALQSVRVCCAENKRTTSFKSLMIKKCESLLESDKAHQKDSAEKLKAINSCSDPCYNLDNIVGTLNNLMSAKSLSSKAKLKIKDVLALRANKWTPKLVDCDPKDNE